jgi:serine/threonine-protein kinase
LTSVGVALGTPATWRPSRPPPIPTSITAPTSTRSGVVAFEVLTGHTPFAGRSAGQMLAAHATVAPPPVAEDRPTTPASARAARNAVSRETPADRPQSADEVLHALDAVTTPQ